MVKEINISTNRQYWGIKNALEDDGYKKTSDCYWIMIFEKGDQKVIINRK